MRIKTRPGAARGRAFHAGVSMLAIAITLAASVVTVSPPAAYSATGSTEQSTQLPPTRRQYPSMVYDVAHRRTVLFGGAGSSGLLGDSWVFDGTRWKQVLGAGPPARHSASMVYDVARRRTVLFGGLGSSSSHLGDTWVFDGARWQKVAGAGPPARHSASMVYDGARRRTVLFGGYGGSSTLGDTWVFDGARWKKVLGAGPPARHSASMVYDGARRQEVLFGGFGKPDGGVAGSGYREVPTDFGDSWVFDGLRWKKVSGAGPPPRGEVSMVYDVAHRRTVLFGGFGCNTGLLGQGMQTGTDADSTSYCGDTWVFDGARWKKVPGSGPPPRRDASMVYDVAHRRTVLFGGYGVTGESGVAGTPVHEQPTHGDLGDTWEFDGTRWKKVSGAGPAPRREASVVFDVALRRMVLFGGQDSSGLLGDTWVFDGARWKKRA